MFACAGVTAATYQGEIEPWYLLHLGLTGDVYTLIDAADFSWIAEHAWNYHYKHWHRADALYARRNTGSARATVYLHREIMRRADPRSERYMHEHVVDHANRNPLDNRRCNLRWATKRQNALNVGFAPSLAEIMAAHPNPPDIEIPF